MSVQDKPWRHLKPGDRAVTHYHGTGHLKAVTIMEVCDDGSQGHSQSGVLYRVHPPISPNNFAWIDSDWFRPTFEMVHGEGE